MKVCFLSSMHPPRDKRVFHKEARTLAAEGYRVVHVAPGDGSTGVVDGVEMVTYRASGGICGRLVQLAGLYRLACRIDADIYHCNEVDSFVIGIALRILRGRRAVFDVHEHYPENFAEQYGVSWMQPFLRVAVSLTIKAISRAAAGVVLAKSSLEQHFSHLPSDRVHLVENFVSLSTVGSSARPGDLQSPIGLVHLGLMSRKRGWHQLLQAMADARHQNTELLILGTISDGSGGDLHQAITDLGLDGRVRCEAWLPYEEAMESVRSADIGLVTFQPGVYNHVHALPHKLFDYMAAELAVIAPAFAEEVAAIVREANCGLLVDSASPESIADAIDHLCSCPEQMRALGRNGRTAVLNRFNWEAESVRLLAMYQDLNARRAR